MGKVSQKDSKVLLALLISLFCISVPTEAQQTGAGGYPRIGHLDLRDPLFSQLAEDVAASHRAFARGDLPPPLVFYSYTVRDGEDLLSVAASTNLGVATLSTVNSIPHPEDVTPGMTLVLPNIPGIFVAADAKDDLERMTLALRMDNIQEGFQVVIRSTGERKYVFFPADEFQPVERAYFLGILFRFPLREGYVSSSFGMRTHPISGVECMHSGVDLAAPRGTEVLAARGGKVIEKGWDETGLGNYLVLAHDGGYTTLYGHLAIIAVTLNQEVNSGSLLGTVGSTGLSTGPHLHFEVRTEGRLRDPMPLIYGNKE